MKPCFTIGQKKDGSYAVLYLGDKIGEAMAALPASDHPDFKEVAVYRNPRRVKLQRNHARVVHSPSHDEVMKLRKAEAEKAAAEKADQPNSTTALNNDQVTSAQDKTSPADSSASAPASEGGSAPASKPGLGNPKRK